jgi:hypothetical protein
MSRADRTDHSAKRPVPAPRDAARMVEQAARRIERRVRKAQRGDRTQ